MAVELPWSAQELALLKQRSADVTLENIQQVMPHRTLEQLRTKWRAVSGLRQEQRAELRKRQRVELREVLGTISTLTPQTHI